MSDNTRHKIYTAALLHDIGKFYQRADVFNRDKSSYFEQLEQTYREAEPFLCPKYNDNYSHKHVLWTAQFIEKILNYHERLAPSDDPGILLMAVMHHKPAHLHEHIITLADHLSSSADRNRLTGDVQHENDWGDYKKTPLLSVFEQIGKSENSGYNYRMPVKDLQIADIMPVQKEEIPDVEKAYAELWNRFETEIKTFFAGDKTNLNQKNTVETLYFLLQKYLVNVPSSTQDIPDVSLFDHSKTTAAFALCLYDYIRWQNIKDANELNKLRNDKDRKPFLLLGADLSGIQSYLYKIKSKFAAKNLKGRSFLLHLIGKTIAQRLIDSFDLYQSNIIYNSGGGFFMLLPNTEDVITKLKSLKKDLNREMLDKFGGELYVALAWESIDMPAVFDKQIHQIWSKVFEKLGQDKQQRFKDLITGDYDSFFEASGDPDNSIPDSITGEEIPTGEVINIEDMNLSKLTKAQIDLGKELKKSRYWYMIKDGWTDKEGGLSFWGYHHLLKEEEDIRLADLQNVLKFRFNDTDFLTVKSQNIQGFEFYGGNDYPVDEEGDPKTFDQYTKGAYNKLGFIRMDVDNLGYIFKNGFAEKQKTFSRYATLSRNLDLFFRAYINYIWAKNPEYKKYTFILYAGGDDLFILGDWQVVQSFAGDIRNSFKKYVCNNPYISISGGELIVPPKFPVLKAADMVADAEKLAKSYIHKGIKLMYKFENNEKKIEKQKDAFTLFDTALAWDKEYIMVKKKANELYQKVTNNELPKAFLQKLMMYHQRQNEPQTQWLMAYDFSRMAKRYNNQAGYIMDILKDILNNTWERQTFNSPYNSFKLYALAARLAELLYRDNKQ